MTIQALDDEIKLLNDNCFSYQPKPPWELRRTAGNVAMYLQKHPLWSGCLRYNRVTERVVWAKSPPLASSAWKYQPKAGSELSDPDLTFIAQWLQLAEGVQFSPDHILAGVMLAAHAASYDPLQEYLTSLRWDGTERVQGWLTTYLGVPYDAQSSSVGRWWLISAVARAMQPGCQADYCLVLEGKQGKRKSSAIAALCHDNLWYRGSLPRLSEQRKTVIESLIGAWIVEIAELNAIKGAGIFAVKTFLTERKDQYRTPYGRVARDIQRHCVFVATTNEDQYMEDHTGNRRFWPVRCEGNIEIEKLKLDRDQLWAEAHHLYQEDAEWWPSDDWTEFLAEEVGKREITDDRSTVIVTASEAWLRTHPMENYITGADAAFTALGIDLEHYDRTIQTIVGNALVRAGWLRNRIRVSGSTKSVYYPPLAWERYGDTANSVTTSGDAQPVFGGGNIGGSRLNVGN